MSHKIPVEYSFCEGGPLSQSTRIAVKRTKEASKDIIRHLQKEKLMVDLEIFTMAMGRGEMPDIPPNAIGIIGMLANLGMHLMLEEMAAEEKAQSN